MRQRLTIILAPVIFSLSLLVLLACGGGGTAATVVSGTPTVAPTAKPFTVGQAVKVGNWVITIHAVTESTGDQFDVPTGVYLILDMSFQNTDSQSHSISSLLQFTLTDSTGQKYTVALTGLSGITAPDGDVQAGKSVRGQTVYDVPKTEKSFEFTFEDVISGNAPATWDLTVS